MKILVIRMRANSIFGKVLLVNGQCYHSWEELWLKLIHLTPERRKILKCVSPPLISNLDAKILTC